jgi:hypothetical protein
MNPNKNIHLLSTLKPSKLYFNNGILILDSIEDKCYVEETKNQHIYITSDKEIKEGDWCYHPLLKGGSIIQSKFDNPNSTMKKIILTTDDQLIKDGVQAIDDEFIEWFVKNPNCNSFEVEKEENLWYCCDFFKEGEEKYCINSMPRCPKCNSALGGNPDFTKYKIIIPKEEPKFVTVDVESANSEDLGKISYIPLPGVDYTPKQETLEEVANKANGYNVYAKETKALIFNEGFIAGAKWQQENTNVNALNFEIDSLKRQVEALKHQKEQMYSEEEFLSFGKSCFYKGFEKSEKDDANCYTAFREEIGSIIEQFKNK